jgi:hypothetical protein
MASRPRLPKANLEMQRWSAALGDEISTWPHVSSRPMFGMLAFYRGKNIFAALPRTRAVNTPSSLMVKLPSARHKRLQTGHGPGAGWRTFEMTSDADLGEALRWLERAYERARTRAT